MESEKNKDEEIVIGVESENVAVPEVYVGGREPENDEKETDGEIDYDCAIPEFHIKPTKKD